MDLGEGPGDDQVRKLVNPAEAVRILRLKGIFEIGLIDDDDHVPGHGLD